MTDKAKWLAQLKAGNLVMGYCELPRSGRLQRVVHTTRTVILTDDGLRFRREDGAKLGTRGPYFHWIEKPDNSRGQTVESIAVEECALDIVESAERALSSTFPDKALAVETVSVKLRAIISTEARRDGRRSER